MKPRFPVFLLALSLVLTGAFAEKPKGPERWEKDIAAFETRDEKTAPPSKALLFVGSSSIRLWDLETSWPETRAINNGFGGSTVADSVYHYRRLIARYTDPAALLIYAGDNDINNGLTPEEVSEDFAELVAKFRADFPTTPVIYIAIKPSQARWELWPQMKRANDLIAAQCQEGKYLHFADIAEPMLKGAESAPDPSWFVADGLHLSEFGYREWTRVVNAALDAAGVKH